MSFSFLYITTPDKQEAEDIGQYLMQHKLAACANIIPHMESVYRWEGKIHHGKEVILLLKTRSNLVEKARKEVEKMHSYDCPCILEFKVSSGNEKYLDWMEKQLS